jgi:hypothetical protein
MTTCRKWHILNLPEDIQTSILAFLAYGALVRFAALGPECRIIATRDRLWNALFTRHFGKLSASVAPPTFNRAWHFCKLAVSPCFVCHRSLLSAKWELQNVENIIASGNKAHQCSLCGELCCAACRCPDADCQLAAAHRPYR